MICPDLSDKEASTALEICNGRCGFGLVEPSIIACCILFCHFVYKLVEVVVNQSFKVVIFINTCSNYCSKGLFRCSGTYIDSSNHHDALIAVNISCNCFFVLFSSQIRILKLCIPLTYKMCAI